MGLLAKSILVSLAVAQLAIHVLCKRHAKFKTTVPHVMPASTLMGHIANTIVPLAPAPAVKRARIHPSEQL